MVDKETIKLIVPAGHVNVEPTFDTEVMEEQVFFCASTPCAGIPCEHCLFDPRNHDGFEKWLEEQKNGKNENNQSPNNQ